MVLIRKVFMVQRTTPAVHTVEEPSYLPVTGSNASSVDKKGMFDETISMNRFAFSAFNLDITNLTVLNWWHMQFEP